MRPVSFLASPRGVVALAFAASTSLLLLSLRLAQAQDSGQPNVVRLPSIDVIASRLGTTSGPPASIGIVGSSTTVITAEEIARSTTQSLPELLSEQPGI